MACEPRGFAKKLRKTLLMKNWNKLQQNFVQKLLEYYQQTRYELGYDIAFNENYPLVETTDQILEMIELDRIVVPYGNIRKC